MKKREFILGKGGHLGGFGTWLLPKSAAQRFRRRTPLSDPSSPDGAQAGAEEEAVEEEVEAEALRCVSERGDGRGAAGGVGRAGRAGRLRGNEDQTERSRCIFANREHEGNVGRMRPVAAHEAVRMERTRPSRLTQTPPPARHFGQRRDEDVNMGVSCRFCACLEDIEANCRACDGRDAHLALNDTLGAEQRKRDAPSSALEARRETLCICTTINLD